MNFLIVLVALISIIALMFLLLSLYEDHGFMKKLFHDKLGYHTPGRDGTLWYDGCSNHSKCKYCGKSIIQDSQGNWF